MKRHPATSASALRERPAMIFRVRSRGTRLARVVLLILACALATLATAEAPRREAWQVVFGTRGAPGRGSATDEGRLVVEADNGDLVVAGTGDSSTSDVACSGHLYPMLARIDRGGAVLWTRVYDTLDRRKILAVRERRGQHFLLVKSWGGCAQDDAAQDYDLTLWRADANGVLERKLVVFEDFGVQSVATHARGFVVAGIPSAITGSPCGLSTSLAFCEIGLDGEVTTHPFPADLEGAINLIEQADGTLVFFYGPGATPQGVMTVGPDGRIVDRFALDDDHLDWKLAAAGEHLLLTARARGAGAADVARGYTRAGALEWERVLLTGQMDRHVIGLTALPDGGALLVASFDGQALLIRLTRDGAIASEQRFASGAGAAEPAGVALLADGSIAVSGSTGELAPGSWDRDAFLAVTDVDGRGLAPYARCLAAVETLQRLQRHLHDAAGMTVTRDPWRRGDTPESTMPAPGQRVDVPRDCGEASDAAFLDFLDTTLHEAQRLDLHAPLGSPLQVWVVPAGAAGSAGVLESFDSIVPVLAADVGHAREAVSYAARELYPYLERAAVATRRLHDRWHIYLRPARDRYNQGGPAPLRESVAIAERTLDLLEGLSPEQRARMLAITSEQERTGGYSLEPVADTNTLHQLSEQWLLAGIDRVDELPGYLLDALPALKVRIAAAQRELRAMLALEVESNPELPPASFAEVLERLVASANELAPAVRSSIAALAPTIGVGPLPPPGIVVQEHGVNISVDPAASDRLFSFLIANEQMLLERRGAAETSTGR